MWHLQSTIGHMLGLLIVVIVLLILMLIGMLNPSIHPQILTLLGTLGGAVVGYYFKGQNKSPKPPIPRVVKSKATTKATEADKAVE